MHDTLQATDVSNGRGTFLVGMLCGAAVGAAIGLMLAPKAGPELRRQLWDSTEGLRHRAGDAYGSASTVVSDVIARGRQAVEAGRETFQRNRPSATNPAEGMTSMP